MAEELGSTRESLAWNPGRENVHADEKTGEPEVFLEPFLWGLFSLGGFITAFFSAVLSWREPSSRVLWPSSQALLRPPSPPVAELAPPSGSACRRNPSPGPGRAPSFRLLVPDPRARPRRVRSATPPRSAPSWSKAPGFGRCPRSRFHPR